MDWNKRIRQIHRWLAVIFTVTLIVTIAALALQGPVWLSYVPLLPLALLLFSGLGLLVSWYTATRRDRAAVPRQEVATEAPRPAQRVRRLHRWSGIVFLLTVLATFVALAPEDPIVWVSYLPLVPLAVLLFSGLYMVALPFAAKRRAAATHPQPGLRTTS
ncbi:hypothetical protein IU427_30560 [Nocardia beijingensis]|uniref:hypothetical protein n=1 Tax=Nocardia beijingensis TaxID=95162 RepID=UPI0018941A8B|nr:hypothetical protein [Nocardia beijingensis]MBF6469475.1 hypothetical protein [Nocardia beijingensis]